MKQRPILFSTPMVQAILEGRKTQTRRIVKPQPPIENIDKDPCLDFDRGVEKGSMENPVIYAEWAEWGDEFLKNAQTSVESHCVYSPFGKTGDVLWVRETFTQTQHGKFVFRSDATDSSGYKWNEIIPGDPNKEVKWKPSIHMPKSACRIWLQITNVRVERLQDITVEDAIAEGIEKRSNNYQFKNYENENQLGFSQPRDSFQSLWKSINGEQSWNDNPWVWVIEFERIENPNL